MYTVPLQFFFLAMTAKKKSTQLFESSHAYHAIFYYAVRYLGFWIPRFLYYDDLVEYCFTRSMIDRAFVRI